MKPQEKRQEVFPEDSSQCCTRPDSPLPRVRANPKVRLGLTLRLELTNCSDTNGSWGSKASWKLLIFYFTALKLAGAQVAVVGSAVLAVLVQQLVLV